MMKMTMFVIALAPVGVAALIASLVAVTGPQVFRRTDRLRRHRGRRAGAALLRHAAAAVLAGHAPQPVPCDAGDDRGALHRFLHGLVLRARFPSRCERVEHGVGVSNKVSSFVLPIGATVNMDGTALYECVAVIFVSQLYAAANPEFTLTLGSQLMIVFLALMVSVGAAGMPHAGLVMMVIIFKAIGVPVELAGLLWAVDRPLDMCRTVVNIWSDTMGTVAIAHTEGEIDESKSVQGRLGRPHQGRLNRGPVGARFPATPPRRRPPTGKASERRGTPRRRSRERPGGQPGADQQGAAAGRARRAARRLPAARSAARTGRTAPARTSSPAR